jgi:hypothetical protein
MAAAAIDTPNMDQQVDLSTIPISPSDGEHGSTEAKDDGKPVTVFHDKDNFTVKHPLQSKWTLWFTKPPSGKVRTVKMEQALSWPNFGLRFCLDEETELTFRCFLL